MPHRLRCDDGLAVLQRCGVGGLHGRLQLGLVDGRHFGLFFEISRWWCDGGLRVCNFKCEALARLFVGEDGVVM